jgi:hypothetical protein
MTRQSDYARLRLAARAEALASRPPRNGLALACSLLLLVSGCATRSAERVAGTDGETMSVASAWSEFAEPAKMMYVIGFNSGWKMAVVSAAVEEDGSSERAAQRAKRFDAHAPDQLVKFLDGFYADPQNQFVTLDFALDLVVDKAAGIDIGPALGKAREIGRKNARMQSQGL